jgi:hypothetical protein
LASSGAVRDPVDAGARPFHDRLDFSLALAMRLPTII